jgi:hypothetical protein
MKKPYHSPSLTEWGTVSELTQGTGHTQYTDAEPCTTPGDVTFYGSSDASFCN